MTESLDLSGPTEDCHKLEQDRFDNYFPDIPSAGFPRLKTLRSTAAKDPKTEMFIEMASTRLPIEFKGREIELEAHAFEDDTISYQAMAVVHRGHGKVDHTSTAIPLVRVHSGCVTGDIFHSLRCDCYAQLQLSLEQIINSDLGIVVYLPHHEGRGIGLVKKIKAYAAQDRGLDTVDANLAIGAPIDARDYELPAKILKHLGYESIRLMSNNPAKLSALTQHGIKIVEQVKTMTDPSQHNERYLATKRDRMDHML
jgi:GTP cyclohydrolase II